MELSESLPRYSHHALASLTVHSAYSQPLLIHAPSRSCGAECSSSFAPGHTQPHTAIQASGSGNGNGSQLPHANSTFSLGVGLRKGPRSIAVGMGVGCGTLAHGAGQARAAWLWPFRIRGGNGKAASTEGTTRVMILMSDTGGGHRASAQALEAGFQKLYGNRFQIDVVDMWTHHTPWPYNQLPKSYNSMVKYPIVWRLGYMFTQPRIVHVPVQTVTACIVSRQVSAAYEHFKPDLVVSVHPLMQTVPLRVLRSRIARGEQDPVNFATVVTDFTTCHNTWFNPGVSKCFVATEEAKARALRMGLSEAQVVVHGLPIRPAFSGRLPSKARLRKRLGLLPDKPAVLLVGGGEGMGPVEKTMKALVDKAGPQIQVVVVCGRNKSLIKRLSSKPYPEGMRVVVKGFVNDMELWMAACDLIITKAGPGTIAESLISGLPVLLNGFVPCQEEGNIQFVVDNKVGAFEKVPFKIAELVREWTGPKKAELQQMGERARLLGQPEALTRIVSDLAELSKHPSTIMQRRRRQQAQLAAA